MTALVGTGANQPASPAVVGISVQICADAMAVTEDGVRVVALDLALSLFADRRGIAGAFGAALVFAFAAVFGIAVQVDGSLALALIVVVTDPLTQLTGTTDSTGYTSVGVVYDTGIVEGLDLLVQCPATNDE